MTALEHLAILAPRWVGDVAQAEAVMRAAVLGGSASRVSIVIRKGLSRLLRDGPLEGHLHEIGGSRDEGRAYRELGADAVLLLSNSFGSALRAWRAGVPVRAGQAMHGRGPLLTHGVIPARHGLHRSPVPTSDLVRAAAGRLGIHVGQGDSQLFVGEAVRGRESERLRKLGLPDRAPYVLCCPGAGFGAAKRWAPQRFAETLDALWDRHGLRGVVSGGPGEEGLIEEVVKQADSGPISLATEDRDLEGLKALTVGAALVLVGDSGPRHVAAALGTPCVMVLGPTFLELTAVREGVEAVWVPELECRPCLARNCPLGHHRCMQDLSTTTVLRAAERALTQGVGARGAMRSER